MLNRRMIDLLLSYGGHVFNMRDARRLFEELYEAKPEIVKITLPIACYLVRCRNWKSSITSDVVIDYVLPRLSAIAALNELPQTDEVGYDPVNEYKAAIAIRIGELHGMKHHPQPIAP